MKKVIGFFILALIVISFIIVKISPDDLKDFSIFMTILSLGIFSIWAINVLNKYNNLKYLRICYLKSLYENITNSYIDYNDENSIIKECYNFLDDAGWVIKLEPEFNQDGVSWYWQLLVYDSSEKDYISNYLSSGLYGENEDYNTLTREKAFLDALVFGMERYYLDSKINPELFKKFSDAKIQFGSVFHLINYVQEELTSELLKVTGSLTLHQMSDTRYEFNDWITELNNKLIKISKEKYGK